MSYQDDLDWLARNIHEWRDGSGFVGKLGSTVYWRNKSLGPDSKFFTKDEWLARRAELQNKPIWDHEAVPAWATALAQDQDGEWKWLGDNVTQYVDGFTADKIRAQCKGIVLGDWRDTLERRPGMHKTTEEIDTSSERVQETDKSMGKWHERGELPPVGTECVIWSEGRFPPAECKIVAYSMEQVCVRWNGNGDLDVIDLQFKNPIECKFRPIRLIRTERNALIDAVHSATIVSVHSAEAIADAILAAGFRREGGES